MDVREVSSTSDGKGSLINNSQRHLPEDEASSLTQGSVAYNMTLISTIRAYNKDVVGSMPPIESCFTTTTT